ncbi:unnamed protein product [Calypogeia fissa]
MRTSCWLPLPPFPKSWGYKHSIPTFHHCLSIDGKIYLLGRAPEVWEKVDEYREVFMLDVAGQREWKRCADMPQPRLHFGCGVAEGKIYVIGGYPTRSSWKRTCECLVYDPGANTWSPIRPLKQDCYINGVFGVGKELFVMHFLQDHPARLEVYHVDKDEWRSLGPWQESLDEDECKMLEPWSLSKNWREKMFLAQGKLHMATPFGIYIYSGGSDGNLKLWTRLHSYWGSEEHYKYPRYEEMGTLEGLAKSLRRLPGIVGNDEPVALGGYGDFVTLDTNRRLYRSRGFNVEKEEIVWDLIVKLKDYVAKVNFCSVQL